MISINRWLCFLLATANSFTLPLNEVDKLQLKIEMQVSTEKG